MPSFQMNSYAKVVLSGLLISFLGALPFGTLNLTAFDIAASQSLEAAWWFAAAVVLVELGVVRLTLIGNERLHLGEKFSFYIIPFGIILLLYLALSSFQASVAVSEASSKIGLLPKISSAFVLGLLLSALNPLQVPFWMTWNKVLSGKGVLKKSKTSYNGYLLGIGIGTVSALALFILAGKYIFSNYDNYSTVTNILMGLLYLGFSIYLSYLFFKKRLNLKIQ
ncbi:LysE family transporter [Flagellimonas flava]|uniref:Threonine/homoserine/homoserine lactone efflux protein n=1 Tax=Flagellimonas flava TaxID=570519 RepID=A0A1M5N8W1_9FLAO|nr:LysE family transporter [Allomuricauda flava]SHG85915.1 Threonine/homoserine/homoserine lactone efflux protein [Allomuricauda flava]